MACCLHIIDHLVHVVQLFLFFVQKPTDFFSFFFYIFYVLIFRREMHIVLGNIGNTIAPIATM
jgi:hypothetical protein